VQRKWIDLTVAAIILALYGNLFVTIRRKTSRRDYGETEYGFKIVEKNTGQCAIFGSQK